MKANGDPEDRKKQLQSLFDSNTEFVVLTEVPHSFFMLSKKKNSLLSFPQFSSALNIELNSIRTPYIDDNAYSRNTYDIILSRKKELNKNQYNLEYIDFHR